MDFFNYHHNKLFCEDVEIAEIVKNYQTPLYIYSESTLNRHLSAMTAALPEALICFALKANSNLTYLSKIFNYGVGADVVSVGEIQRAIKAKCPSDKIVFSGVGKTNEEIDFAIENKILLFNVESIHELTQINERARIKNTISNICLRVNPNLDAQSNPKISTGLDSTKFGIPLVLLKEVVSLLNNLKHISFKGFACHIGSQMTSLNPLISAIEQLRKLINDIPQNLRSDMQYINLGGGVGVRYIDENPPSIADYAKLVAASAKNLNLKLILEPGRILSANTGVLVTKVLGIKENQTKKFIILDAAMNDLMRPALYDAEHEIIPCEIDSESLKSNFDIVGPVCETTDIFAKNRLLATPKIGDLLAIRTCGAYGFSMASNYNTRPKPAEVLVHKSETRLIRKRESIADLWQLELDL